MATEYISREAALAEIKRFIGYLDEDMIERLQIAIRRILAADVVEVVRCKDCIHAGARDCPIDWPKNWEDYCSFGERRDDNG